MHHNQKTAFSLASGASFLLVSATNAPKTTPFPNLNFWLASLHSWGQLLSLGQATKTGFLGCNAWKTAFSHVSSAGNGFFAGIKCQKRLFRMSNIKRLAFSNEFHSKNGFFGCAAVKKRLFQMNCAQKTAFSCKKRLFWTKSTQITAFSDE